MEETLEEAAENFAITIQTKEGTVSRLNAIEWFKAGAKWQQEQERMYSKEEVQDILRKSHSIKKLHEWFLDY